MADPVCVKCLSKIPDAKSLITCSQCPAIFHANCIGVTDLRGFHMRRASWKCPKCANESPAEGDKNRKRQRVSESGDSITVDMDMFKELLDTIKALNNNVIDLKNEMAAVKDELVEVRKVNKSLVEKMSFIEQKQDDKQSKSFADVMKNQGRPRGTPSRQPNKQVNQVRKELPKVTLEEVNKAVSNAIINLNQPVTENDGFLPVTSRKKGIRKPVAIGQMVPNDGSNSSQFEGTERRHWVYVGRVKSGTTPESITSFVKSTWKIEDVLCNQLASNDDICSFKVGVRESHIPSLLDPSKWPKGVAIREFVFIPKRSGNFGNKDNGNFQKSDQQNMET